MADKTPPNMELVTSSSVLRDYIYSRLRSGARLTLSDKLLGLAFLSREAARAYGQLPKAGEAPLPPQAIGQLTGYLLSGRTDNPDSFSAPALPSDYFNISCGRIAKFRT